MVNPTYLRHLKKWINEEDIVIPQEIIKNEEKYIRYINYSKWVKFELKIIDEKLFLKKLKVEERLYLRECYRINEVYKSELLDTLEKILEKELNETNIVTFWTRNAGKVTQKNIDNSFVILKQKFIKANKMKEYTFFELLLREIENKYNNWMKSSKYSYNIFISNEIVSDKE